MFELDFYRFSPTIQEITSLGELKILKTVTLGPAIFEWTVSAVYISKMYSQLRFSQFKRECNPLSLEHGCPFLFYGPL